MYSLRWVPAATGGRAQIPAGESAEGAEMTPGVLWPEGLCARGRVPIGLAGESQTDSGRRVVKAIRSLYVLGGSPPKTKRSKTMRTATDV